VENLGENERLWRIAVQKAFCLCGLLRLFAAIFFNQSVDDATGCSARALRESAKIRIFPLTIRAYMLNCRA
jgi:hypothetical protein